MATYPLTRRLGLIALLLALGFALPACHSSNDEEVYQSTVGRPTTVQIQDAFTHQVLWTKDIPPEFSLEVDFEHEGGVRYMSIDPHPPTSFHWEMDNSDEEMIDEGDMPLPNTPVVVAQVIRPRPEYAPLPGSPAAGAMPPTAAAVPPAQPAPPVTPTLNIGLANNDTIRVGRHTIDIEGLKELVNVWVKQFPDGLVVITAAPGTTQQLVSAVRSACESGGISHITVLTPVTPPASAPEVRGPFSSAPPPAAPAPAAPSNPAVGPQFATPSTAVVPVPPAPPAPPAPPIPPAPPTPRAVHLEPVTVHLSGVGRITIGTSQLNEFDFENVVDSWSQVDRTRPIIIVPEADSSQSLLKDVRTVCRDYGMTNVTVAAPSAAPHAP
jgi:biopolymer transport protein ExbD